MNIQSTSVDNKNWVMNATGVVGLAPNADFWSFFYKNYQVSGDEVFLRFNLQNGNSKSYSDLFASNSADLYTGSSFTFGVRLSDVTSLPSSNILFHKVDSTTQFWDYPSVTVTMDIKSTSSSTQSSSTVVTPYTFYSNEEACIDYNEANYFITDKFQDWSNLASQYLCGKNSCPSSTDLSNGANIYVTMKDSQGHDITITVAPSDYFVKVGDNWVAAFQDASSTSSNCKADASFGFGRGFLLKNNFIFKKQKSGDAYVAFTGGNSSSSSSADSNPILLIVSAFVIVFGILALTMALSYFGPTLVDKEEDRATMTTGGNKTIGLLTEGHNSHVKNDL